MDSTRARPASAWTQTRRVRVSDPNDSSIPVLHEVLVPGKPAEAHHAPGGAAAPATQPVSDPETAQEPFLAPEPTHEPEPVPAPESKHAPEPVPAPETLHARE